jgi:hypothetical protein
MRAPLSLSLLPRLGAAALLSILLACSGDGITVPGDGSIARLVAVAGDGQQAIAGEPVPQPLVVRAVDRSDRPVTGVEIAFRFINTDGRVAPGTVATGVDGQATAEVTLGGSVGAQVVEARLVDPQGLAVEFELTALQRESPEGGGGGGGGNGNDGGGNGGNGCGGNGNGNGGNGGHGHGDDGGSVGGGGGSGGGGDVDGGSGGGSAGDDDGNGGGGGGGGDDGRGNGGDGGGGHGHGHDHGNGHGDGGHHGRDD